MSIQMSLTVPALERLIKDDPEVELKLKEGVIANFVDRHLRKLLNDDFLKQKIHDMTVSIEKNANSIIAKEFGAKRDSTWGNPPYTLSGAFVDKLRSQVIAQVDAYANEAIKKQIESKLKDMNVEMIMDRYIQLYIKELAKSEVDKRAKELLAEALKK